MQYASVVKTFCTFRERFGCRAPLCEWMKMKMMQTILSRAMRWAAVLAWVCLVVGHASAAVRYVDVNSASPTPPYDTWATAATALQDAIDVADDDDEVVVTNGVYQAGVWVSIPLTIRSMNGAELTVI